MSNSFSDLFAKKTSPQLILSILFIIYLAGNYKMNDLLATAVDSPFGKIIVVLVAIILFAYANPVLGVLGLMVAYRLVKSASAITGTSALAEYYPTEQKKWAPFTAIRQFPYTLEQEIVKKMTTQKFNPTYVKTKWRPVLDDTYDAQYVNKE